MSVPELCCSVGAPGPVCRGRIRVPHPQTGSGPVCGLLEPGCMAGERQRSERSFICVYNRPPSLALPPERCLLSDQWPRSFSEELEPCGEVCVRGT